MGQKVNPISNRLGVIRGWDSNWYGGKKYGETLLEDSKIRKYLRTRLAKASVSRIIIERTLKMVTVTICTSRPGVIIGKGGQTIVQLQKETGATIKLSKSKDFYPGKPQTGQVPELDFSLLLSSFLSPGCEEGLC